MFDGTRALSRTADGSTRIGKGALEPMIRAQIATTAATRALGKRVVVISPPSQASFDIDACWERTLGGLPTVMPSSGGTPPCAITQTCAITQKTSLRETPAGAVLTNAFETRAVTPVIRLDRAMCSRGVCPTSWNGTLLYGDGRHLNSSGSMLIGQRFSLGDRAWERAR